MRAVLSRRAALVAAAALAVAAPFAHAQQNYPNKPIRLLVGYSAGGGVDALSRMLAQRLSTVLGQQVVVENRAGATGMIAADLVARSAPDGYTLLMGESGLLIAPFLQAKSPIDPLKALTPVAGAFIAPLMIVVNNDVPGLGFRPNRERIAELAKRPGSRGVGKA